MAIFPKPVTQENFPKAWRCVRRKYKQARVKAAIRRIAQPIGEILFFPAFLMLAYGAAASFTPANVQALVLRLPIVAPLWLQLKEVLFGSATTVLDYVIRAAGFLYVVPFAVFLAASALIILLYHPKGFAISGDLYQDAQAMWSMARYAQADAKRKGSDLAGTLSLIAGILAAIGALFVIFYWLLFPGGDNLLAGIGVYQTLRLFGIALILIFAYAPVALPLGLLMKLVHWCPGAKRMAEAAEIFCRGLRKTPAPVVPAAVPVVPVAAAAAPMPAPAEVPAEAHEKPQEAPQETQETPEEAPETPLEPAETPAE